MLVVSFGRWTARPHEGPAGQRARASSVASCENERVVNLALLCNPRQLYTMKDKRHNGRGRPLSPGYDAASGGAGVSLLCSRALEQLGAVQAPAAVHLCGLVRGAAADQSVLAVSGTHRRRRPITAP